DVVLVGDWDGDRDDTFAVRRGVTYYVANEIRGGEADQVATYGRVEDTALVGDWDGDGRDTLGVRRGVVDADMQYDLEMVQIINRHRAAEGVPPMEHWSRLRQGALDHSRRMLAGDFFEHASHDIIGADTSAAGCRGGYGENIFWSDGYPADPEIAMQQYMESPGHRANILHPNLRYVATGTVQSGRELYNTQRFAVDCG
ncbi:CAP domain-containing protein, partial [Georgenia sp. 10Sc9-8]|nr:CAP domain-containing protein [Georgenia halotolerans]